MLMERSTEDAVSRFALDVREGLSKWGQKELPSKYLYDPLGSALFEVICQLPEYGLTRAEDRLLRKHSDDVVARVPGPITVAELGSGTGKKTRILLEALGRRQPTTYHPIEISRAALALCRRELSDVSGLSILGLEREYLDGLAEVAARRADDQNLLVLFLGSTIGNFDREASLEFLRQVRQTLRHGDALLLGADLEKPAETLLEAYDDPLGVTAAFNRNLLVRLNRELGADCDPGRFEHIALFNEGDCRIEMHLISTCDQTLRIPAAGLHVSLRESETIWTESSHKFTSDGLRALAECTGFRCEAQWIDREWPFADALWMAD